MRFSKRLILLTTFFLLLAIPATVFLVLHKQEIRKKAQETTQVQAPAKPEYAKGEVIIKLKAQGSRLEVKQEKKAQGVSLESQAVSFADLDQKTLPSSLIEINKRFKIKEIEKVFKGAGDPKADVAAFKARFPQRAAQVKEEAEKIDLSRTYRLVFDKQTSIEKVIQELFQSPEVEYAEPNYIFKAQFVPNDPYYLDSYPDNTGNRDSNWNPSYDYQWNLKKIKMEEAWDITTGSAEIVVAVVDTGVDYTRSELGSCTLEQVNNNQCPKIAPGYDFVNNDNDPMDDNGHGTHVAGIIASLTDNGKGVAGVAPLARTMSVKALDNRGVGGNDWVAQGIKFAADQGARVVNLSLGSELPFPTPPLVLKEALDYAFNLGVMSIAAAGNNNDDVRKGYWPANYKYVVSVGATDEKDQKVPFSNYGKISVVAPGGESSCKLAGQNSPSDPCYNLISLKSAAFPVSDPRVIGPEGEKDFLRLAGTSMAAPHVAGLAALILAKDQALSNLEVKSLLEYTAVDLGGPGRDDNFGYGRIDASKALSSPIPPVAEIFSPSWNENIWGNYSIIGAAFSTNFQNYKIEVGVGLSPTEWGTEGVTLINDGRDPVNNGELGSIETSLYKNQAITIKLTVFSQNGEKKEDRVLVSTYEQIPLLDNVKVNDSPARSLIPGGIADQFGNPYLAWIDYRNDPTNKRGDIYFTKSSNQGISFDPNILISSGDTYSFFPFVGMLENSLFVVFESYQVDPSSTESEGQIVLKKSTDQGESFEITKTLDIPKMSEPKLAGRYMEVEGAAGGNHYLYLTWQAGKLSDDNIYLYFSRFNNQNNSFEETKVIRSITTDTREIPPNPSIITDKNGVVYIAWSEQAPEYNFYYRIFLIKSSDNGQTFTEPEVIFKGDPSEYDNQEYPRLGYDKTNDVIYLTFASATPASPLRDVWISKSDDGGVTFSEPYNVTKGGWINPFGAYFESPVVVNSSGTVFVSWREVPNGGVFLSWSTGTLESFSPPTLVSPQDGDHSGLKITLISSNNDDVFVVYDLFDPQVNNFQILSRRTNLSALTPTPTSTPTPSPTPLPSPTLTPVPTFTPTPTPCPNASCDVNGNGQETVEDYNLIVSCWRKDLSCCPRCDFNCDGVLNVADIQRFVNLCGHLIPTATSTPVPCPRGDLGNLDCGLDGCIHTEDFELFRQDFGKSVDELKIPLGHHTPDLVVDENNRVDTADFEILRNNFGSCLPGFSVD